MTNATRSDRIVLILSERFDRWIRSNEAQERFAELGTNSDTVASEILTRIDVSGDFITACVNSFITNEPGDFRSLLQDRDVFCSVHPNGWLNLSFEFDGFTISYLVRSNVR